MEGEGRSLTETPTWALATVTTFMIACVALFTGSLERFTEWLDKPKRRSLLPALNKIKEELMVVGVTSLLMGHFSIIVAKICIKSSVYNSRWQPCIPETDSSDSLVSIRHIVMSNYSNDTVTKQHYKNVVLGSYCSEGYESFASYESLEQLHRLLFVLGITHVTYSSITIALAIFKIYSWRTWENEAKSIANQISPEYSPGNSKLRRLHTFVHHHASHPWSQRKVLVWLLCFSSQFWSSINKSDYNALRFGFITTHQLPLSYDFHNYMLRSMAEEFRDIVGVSIPLWIYAILCIILDFQGSDAYFWLSFLPAIIIMIIGTKLHYIVVKLAVESMESSPEMINREFKLRDELFWFHKPRLLLRSIQFISFQNAFEMAMFLWSLWEIKGTSCFMKNPGFVAIRLTFGIVSQVWCSFCTFPLYVIITEMGSRFKPTVISEEVRRSLHGWKTRVKAKKRGDSSVHGSLSTSSSMPLIQNLRKSLSGWSSSSSNSSAWSFRTDGSKRLLSNLYKPTSLNEQENESEIDDSSSINDYYDDDMDDRHSEDWI